MEDAMILNKSSCERGFGHASVYKTIQLDLVEEAKSAGASASGEDVRMRFGNKMKKDELKYKNLDGDDGLPRVGDCVKEGDALYCVIDSVNDSDRVGSTQRTRTCVCSGRTSTGNGQRPCC